MLVSITIILFVISIVLAYYLYKEKTDINHSYLELVSGTDFVSYFEQFTNNRLSVVKAPSPFKSKNPIFTVYYVDGVEHGFCISNTGTEYHYLYKNLAQ